MASASRTASRRTSSSPAPICWFRSSRSTSASRSGQILVLAVMLPVLAVLRRYVLPGRVGMIILSAIVADTGWHWMIGRADVLWNDAVAATGRGRSCDSGALARRHLPCSRRAQHHRLRGVCASPAKRRSRRRPARSPIDPCAALSNGRRRDSFNRPPSRRRRAALRSAGTASRSPAGRSRDEIAQRRASVSPVTKTTRAACSGQRRSISGRARVHRGRASGYR